MDPPWIFLTPSLLLLVVVLLWTIGLGWSGGGRCGRSVFILEFDDAVVGFGLTRREDGCELRFFWVVFCGCVKVFCCSWLFVSGFAVLLILAFSKVLLISLNVSLFNLVLFLFWIDIWFWFFVFGFWIEGGWLWIFGGWSFFC